MTQAYAYNLGYLFHRVATERGDAAALTYPDQAVSFAELDRLSSRIAHLLLSRGIGRRDVVAIFHEKTPDAYACMIACLKIGAIYTNLDTSSPAARLGKIIDRAQPKLLVAGESGLGLASELAEARAIDVLQYGCDAFNVALDGLPEGLPAQTRDVVGTDPAYLMFTSGSTGFPKGAVISHGSVQNFVDWANQEIGVGPDDALTNVNPMHFDNSVFDFYAGLFNGARLVPLDEKIARNPRLLVRAAGEAGCTVWFSVPSLLVYTLRMRGLGREDLPAMRKIVFGGEGFPKAPLRQLHELVGDRIQLLNVYGPTECTCICSAYPVQASDLESPALLPLGPIAPNFDFLVVGEDRQPVEDGELGELCLLGPNVGLGYYNDPERTAAAFVQSPNNTGFGEVMYCSGDMVRYDAEADLLHFAGRKDHQIKRMGYRIELEEIENALGSLAEIEENACVFVRGEDGQSGRIYAYVCGANAAEDTLRERLRGLLPPYMMPDSFHVMDVLPKNRNGKIDRKALQEMS